MSPAPRARTRAFTLTEMIVALIVFGLVMAGVMAVFVGALRSMRASSDSIDLNARSRFIQERLLYDLRSIKSVTSMSDECDGSNIFGKVVSSGYRSFTAQIEVYGDQERAVTYTVANGVLQRTVNGTTQTVLTGLTDGCFHFYARGDAGSTATDIGTPLGAADAGTPLGAADAAKAKAIRFAFRPKNRPPLVPGHDDASSSAIVQLRYPTYNIK